MRDSVAHTDLERYTYDANGNRVSAALNGGTAVVSGYDDQDRMTSNGATVSYSYTGNGERRRRIGGSTPHTLTYDALGNLLRVEFASASAKL